jgi:hypothetical protein
LVASLISLQREFLITLSNFSLVRTFSISILP